MKVLFAVNEENISTSIVKKYQKQFKEIISYKSVYYFNAILKELQKNKNYDRIIISEDLEEFSSSSYEQKDRFIFDKLDGITDEAVSQSGTDIPIILICSERRNKGEDILVKMFGIGIYNAIIGDDRSLDEVCRLINKPRSKKEAKIYYKIDVDDVSYEKENESEVSEVEMQNILMHFKRIGKNEEKCVESFRNIVSQYNDEQLKVIIAILPDQVKEILEEMSPEYHRLTFHKGKNNLDKKVSEKEKTLKRKPSEKLLNTGNGLKSSKPVVVPTTMEASLYKKVTPKKQINVDLEEIEDDEIDYEEEPIKEQTRRRGRPRKNIIEEEKIIEEKPKKRGRPKKKIEDISEENEELKTEKIDTYNNTYEDDDEIYENNSINKNEKNNLRLVDETDDDYEEDFDLKSEKKIIQQ